MLEAVLRGYYTALVEYARNRNSCNEKNKHALIAFQSLSYIMKDN